MMLIFVSPCRPGLELLLGEGRAVTELIENRRQQKSTTLLRLAKKQPEKPVKRTAAADVQMEPRESPLDLLPAPPRDTTNCQHQAPKKPSFDRSSTVFSRTQTMANFTIAILGHLIGRGAQTPLRVDGRIVRTFCVWLGYPSAYGPPPVGGSEQYAHRIEYVAMLVRILHPLRSDAALALLTEHWLTSL